MIQHNMNIEALHGQCKCKSIESKIESSRLHYTRFAISPLLAGQTETVAIALRRTLLQDVEGLSITSAKIKGAAHEYITLKGIRESVHDILLNLKEVVLTGHISNKQHALLSIIGPGTVTAGQIRLPTGVSVVDPYQHIASLTKSVNFYLEITIEQGRGNRIQDPMQMEQGVFAVDAVFSPVRIVNYTIHSLGGLCKEQELLCLEVWTNGGVTPEEALTQATNSLINLLLPFLGNNSKIGDNILNQTDQEHLDLDITSSNTLKNSMLEEKQKKFQTILIDQLDMPARAYNCLKKANIETLWDLLKYSEEDLLKIKNLGKKSVERIVKTLKENFALDLPVNGLNID